MDYTYKTNKFKMPLLHFLGVTPIETNFSAGFCFLPGESASDYLWALQSFKFAAGNVVPYVIITDGEDGLKNSCREVFPEVPQRLCLWHINQNVLAKAKTTWKENALGLSPKEQDQRREARDAFMTRWNKLLRSKTPTEYEELWRQLQIDYQEQTELIYYLKTEHHPKREEVSNAWTSHIRHFGHQVTSRIEGGHADIKRTIQKSTGDLLEVTTKICNSLRVKRQDFEHAFAAARFYTPGDVSPARVPIFTKRLMGLVTPQGLRKVVGQYELAKKG